MLIRNAEVWGHGLTDVRCTHGIVAALGRSVADPGETVIDAGGAALLPGLHDHHIHLAAFAAARASVPCGPPEVTDEAALVRTLARPGRGWLRGVGYHESVAGMLVRTMLDRWAPDRPLRIQHRSGRMWFLNSPALALLLAAAPSPPGLDHASGQLFDEDRWLRTALGSVPPDLGDIGALLSAAGVTGVTDMTPGNDAVMAEHLSREQAAGRLPQGCVMAGTLALAETPLPPGQRLGPAKLHLHENALPDFDSAARFVAEAHRQRRPIAVHCVTETELVFTLAVVAEVGAVAGDRIEHAGIAPDALVAEVAALGLQVVTQPHFIAERGDRYLRDVEPRDHAVLYRAAAFQRAGVTLAAGSDAPFGSHDPWAAMRAATSRRTAGGTAIGPDEMLDPEAALVLYLGDPLDLARQRQVEPGAAADLVLLDRPWREARLRLLADDVRMTLVGGKVVHDRIDEPPGQRDAGVDPTP